MTHLCHSCELSVEFIYYGNQFVVEMIGRRDWNDLIGKGQSLSAIICDYNLSTWSQII